MTSYEKYKDEINNSENPCKTVMELRGCKEKCCELECGVCEKANYKWLAAEYTEEIDWSRVEQGTEVYVDDSLIGRFVAIYNDYIIIDRGAGYNSYPKEMCRVEGANGESDELLYKANGILEILEEYEGNLDESNTND